MIFLIALLAVWRLTHLLQAEDGPFMIFFNLRKLGKLFDCFYCLSIWIALIPSIYLCTTIPNIILYCFALSGGAILLEKITDRYV